MSNANGGYAMTPVLRALAQVGGHADPISVTTHFLRPIQGGGRADVGAELVRRGRTVSVARGVLSQGGKDRLTVTAALGDVGGDHADPSIDLPPPEFPGPEDCADRSGSLQGVDLAIASRVDVRLPPARTLLGASDDAVTEGWIRFADGTPPSALALPLFADAFPPSLFSKFGRVGWVPTIELTVHVRRHPVRRLDPGQIRMRRPGRRSDGRVRHALGLRGSGRRPLASDRSAAPGVTGARPGIACCSCRQPFIRVFSRSTDSMNSSIISYTTRVADFDSFMLPTICPTK